MLRAIRGEGLRMRLDPPTIACLDSPARMALHARCSATRLELQAIYSLGMKCGLGDIGVPVSIVALGPFKSKKYEILFDSIVCPVPVA